MPDSRTRKGIANTLDKVFPVRRFPPSRFLLPIAWATGLSVALLFSGCRREETKTPSNTATSPRDGAADSTAARPVSDSSLPPSSVVSPSPTPTPLPPVPPSAPSRASLVVPTPLQPAQPAPTASPNAGSLEGSILLQSTNEPVASVRVTLHPLGSESPGRPALRDRVAVTDAEGRFQFDALEPGTYRINAWKRGLGLLPESPGALPRVTLDPQERKTGLDLTLYSGHTIRGTVTNRLTDDPIPGAGVFAADDSGVVVASSTTDSKGAFALRGITTPRVVLSASAPGLALVTRNQRPVRFALDPDTLEISRDLQMAPAATVSGHVRRLSGRPVAGALVVPVYPDSAFGLSGSTATDANGAFTLRVTPGARMRLLARTWSGPLAWSPLLELKSPHLSGIEVLQDSGGPLEGKVFDPAGKPVPGARVVVKEELCMGTSSRVETLASALAGKSGQFRIVGLPAGSLFLVAEAPGAAASAPASAELPSGKAFTLPYIVVREAYPLAGTVSDPDGHSIPGVRVMARPDEPLTPAPTEVYTDYTGRFRIDGLPQGRVDLTLEHPDFDRRVVYGIPAGKEDLALVLGGHPAYSLRGKVLDWKTGEAFPDFTVSCNAPDTSPQADSEGAGTFSIDNIPANKIYTLGINAGQYPPLSVPLRPGIGLALEETYFVGPGAVLTGTVVNAQSGDPLPDTEVLWMGATLPGSPDAEPQPLSTATTNADGNFRLEGVQGTRAVLLFRPRGEPIQAIRRVGGLRHGAEVDLGTVRVLP